MTTMRTVLVVEWIRKPHQVKSSSPGDPFPGKKIEIGIGQYLEIVHETEVIKIDLQSSRALTAELTEEQIKKVKVGDIFYFSPTAGPSIG